MSEYFDPSPRSSKRRKSNSNGVELSSASEQVSSPSSVLRSVSKTFSGLSRRLFESKKVQPSSPPTHDDSTYGSKEDSLVEEEVASENITTIAENLDITEHPKEATQSLEQRVMRSSCKSDNANIDSEKSIGDSATSSMNRKTGLQTSKITRSGTVEKSAATAGTHAESSHQSDFSMQASPKRGFGSARRTSQRQQFVMNKEVPQSPAKTSSSRKRRLTHMEFDDQPAIPSSDGNLDGSKLANREGSVQDQIEENEDTILTQPRSGGREHRAPRRYSIGLDEPENADPVTLKGILTPSRKGRKSPRKSVVFDNQEKSIEEDLGFKDINKSTKRPVQRMRAEDFQVTSTEVVGESQLLIPARPQIVGLEGLISDISEPEITQDEPLLPDLTEVCISVEEATEEMVPDDAHIIAIKSTVLAWLSSQLNSTSNLFHLQAQYNTLHTLLSSTVTAGESNSLLLLGARGSGKSLLVETALANLRRDYRDDFHVVSLNGFVQTDDKLALREIWRQLGREMQINEEETNEVNSYADTVASLLALLAHPEELLDPNEMGLDGPKETMTARSVIFVLDEFDLFTTHPRQTLLYNLFDIAQARKAPIAVLGCSTRMDVVDCLEKRVKSRFSHRWLHVPSPKNLSEWEEILAAGLCTIEHESNNFNIGNDWADMWNEQVKTSFLPSEPVQSLLRQSFHTTKSLPALLTSLYIPVATLSIQPSSSSRTKQLARTSINFTTGPSSIITLLPSLPVLHLTLLTCAARLESIHNLSTPNFHVTYTHYLDLCARAKLQQTSGSIRIWSREVARGAWEDLGQWEVLVPVESGAGMGLGGKEGGVGAESRMWRVDVGIEEVGWAVARKQRDGGGGLGGMAEILKKWFKEI